MIGARLKIEWILLGILCITLAGGVAHAESIGSREFILCFEKAFNERIQELKAKYKDKDIGICDMMSDKAKVNLINLYSVSTPDLGRAYYSAKSMGKESVRFHFERIQYSLPCYKSDKFIGTAFVKGLGDAIGAYEHTPNQLVTDVFSKILGRDMWAENGSDLFSQHQFEYCRNISSTD